MPAIRLGTEAAAPPAALFSTETCPGVRLPQALSSVSAPPAHWRCSEPGPAPTPVLCEANLCVKPWFYVLC